MYPAGSCRPWPTAHGYDLPCFCWRDVTSDVTMEGGSNGTGSKMDGCWNVCSMAW